MISIWWCVLIPGCVDLLPPKSQLSAGSKQLFDKFLWWTVSEIIVAMLIMLAMAMARCWWWSAEKAWEEGFHTHFRLVEVDAVADDDFRRILAYWQLIEAGEALIVDLWARFAADELPTGLCTLRNVQDVQCAICNVEQVASCTLHNVQFAICANRSLCNYVSCNSQS